jgi:hypothetical protein
MAALRQLPREIYDMIASNLDDENLLNLTRATGLKPYITVKNNNIRFVLSDREDEHLKDLYASVWIKYIITYKTMVVDKRQLKLRSMIRPRSCEDCDHNFCCSFVGCEECCDRIFYNKYMFRTVINGKLRFIVVMYNVLKTSISESSSVYANRLHEYKHFKRDIAKSLFKLSFRDFYSVNTRIFNFCIHVLK